VSLPSYIKSCF